jgi:hypothetical protein
MAVGENRFLTMMKPPDGADFRAALNLAFWQCALTLRPFQASIKPRHSKAATVKRSACQARSLPISPGLTHAKYRSMMTKSPDTVDLALILAFDGSASVTFESFGLIASGTAAALRDPAVVAGLLGGPLGCCLCALLLWSGPTGQEILVEWTRLDSADTLAAFAQQVENVPRIVTAGTTAIGAAMLVCEQMLRGAPFAATRQIIDFAGDGRNNDGPPSEPVRDRLVDAGVTINGLCVLHEESDLVESYRREVIGGTGAFALECQDYTAFADAMRQKLRQEIAHAAPDKAASIPV